MSSMNFGPRTIVAGGFYPTGVPKMGIRVINKSSSTIAVDKLVAITGFDATSGRPKIVLADADVAAHDDIWVNVTSTADGLETVVYKGYLSVANLDTSNFSASGSPVYLSTTAGGFTQTAPSATNSVVQPVGFVLVKDAAVGQIFWYVSPVRKISSNGANVTLDAANLDGVTLDANGAGSTVEVAALGVGTAQLAALSVTAAKMAANTLQIATGTITAANIIGTSAGQLGHANGVVLLAACAAKAINEFVALILSNDFLTAAYTAGGDLSVNIGAGGAALTGVISNANFIQAAADKTIVYTPLAAAPNVYTTANPINLVSTVAPTNPGTAAGVFKWTLLYRVHAAVID
jgi:hypothetical protein